MYATLLPLVLSAVAAMALGSLWYSPMLFGNQWTKLMGIKKKDMKISGAKMAPLFIATFLASMLMSYVLGSLMLVLGVKDAMLGLQLGFLVWLGFVATTSLVNALYANKSLKLYLIDTSYHLVVLMAMGFIFATFSL